MAKEVWDILHPTQDPMEVEGICATDMDGEDKSTIRSWKTLELEIPEEGMYLLPDLTIDSYTPSSAFTKHGASLLSENNPAGCDRERLVEGAVTEASSVRDATSSADEWLCGHPNCGRVFTHYHKLNRHRKYHTKPHKCLEPSCISRPVAFSLKKDLIRHQSTHKARRFYCHQPGCRHTSGGAGRGFTRHDNLKRHIATQHPQFESKLI